MHPQRVMSVRVPENQSTEQAPVMTVTNYTRLEVGLVEYGDERGRKITTVAFLTGNKAFVPPQGEQWTAGFRSFVKAISDQILEKNEELKARETGKSAGTVPTEDAVDVTGGGESMSFSDDQLVETAEQKPSKGGR